MKGLRLLALAAMSVSACAAAPWNVARSQHFEVWSDAPAETARSLNEGLERLYAFFVRQLGISSQGLVRVVCFAGEPEFAEYRIRPGADGYSLTGPDGEYIVIHTPGPRGPAVAGHEYAHLLIHSSGWKLPNWLSEGISEVVSSARFGERYSFIGGDLPGRSRQLKTTQWMTPAELFSGEPATTAEPVRLSLYYSQSWALAEMLIVSPDYAPAFPAFLAMLAKGSTTQAALAGVYRKAADEALNEARARLLRGLTPLVLPPVTAAAAVRESPASDYEVQVTLAGLRHAAGQQDRAEAMYRALAVERPGDPAIPAALGIIALERKDPARAVREWGRALAQGLRDADFCYRYAVLGSDAGLDDAAVRAALERAIALRPAFDEAHFRLGLLERNSSRPKEAMAHFQAMRRPPTDRAWVYYSALADVLLELNQRGEAKLAALDAERVAANDEQRARARQLAYLADTELSVEIAEGRDGRREFRTVRVPVNAPARNPFIEAGEIAYRAEASLDRVECGDDGIRVLVTAQGRPLILSVPDPSRVQIRNAGSVAFEFVCGPQEARKVLVEYRPEHVLRGLELDTRRFSYQTRQAFWLTIGCPALQENAFWNSGMFCTTPLTRNLGGECGSVCDLQAQRLLALVGAPHLAEGEEEALLRREAVDLLRVACRWCSSAPSAPRARRRCRRCSRRASACR